MSHPKDKIGEGKIVYDGGYTNNHSLGDINKLRPKGSFVDIIARDIIAGGIYGEDAEDRDSDDSDSGKTK